MSFTTNATNQLTVTPLRILGRDESKNDLDVWWAKVKIHLKSTIYKDLMPKTWTAKNEAENRGLQEETIGSKTYKADEMSVLVGDMLETVLSFVPEVTQSEVLGRATSLQWLYDYLRKHYGCERTGSDMMNRFETLERKPREKVTTA